MIAYWVTYLHVSLRLCRTRSCTRGSFCNGRRTPNGDTGCKIRDTEVSLIKAKNSEVRTEDELEWYSIVITYYFVCILYTTTF